MSCFQWKCKYVFLWIVETNYFSIKEWTYIPVKFVYWFESIKHLNSLSTCPGNRWILLNGILELQFNEVKIVSVAVLQNWVKLQIKISKFHLNYVKNSNNNFLNVFRLRGPWVGPSGSISWPPKFPDFIAIIVYGDNSK